MKTLKDKWYIVISAYMFTIAIFWGYYRTLCVYAIPTYSV